jgi:hypothetical protein
MSLFRTIFITLAAIVAAAVLSPARADEGFVRISFLKAGWVIGGTVGSGTLTFHGRTYRLSVGGLSYAFTFGGSQTYLQGRARNIYQPSDIEGVYGAGSAGAAIIHGPQAVVLTNQKGALLEVSGGQTGLIVNLDLSGLAGADAEVTTRLPSLSSRFVPEQHKQLPTPPDGAVLSDQPMVQADARRMVRKRALAAGIMAPIGNHSFRATGITAYLANGGTLEHAQSMAAHESPRTTKLYDRTKERLTQDEIERIVM